MTKVQTILFFAFVLALAGVTGYAVYKRSIGASTYEYAFDVEGYDPQEIATAHALKYRLNYGIEACRGLAAPTEAYICLKPRGFSLALPSDCERALRGICKDEQFVAGIERFYVRQEQSQDLAKKLVGRRVGVAISVTPNGLAQVKDLLIDGVPWQHTP